MEHTPPLQGKVCLGLPNSRHMHCTGSMHALAMCLTKPIVNQEPQSQKPCTAGSSHVPHLRRCACQAGLRPLDRHHNLPVNTLPHSRVCAAAAPQKPSRNTCRPHTPNSHTVPRILLAALSVDQLSWHYQGGTVVLCTANEFVHSQHSRHVLQCRNKPHKWHTQLAKSGLEPTVSVFS